jgi:hypothetical protein
LKPTLGQRSLLIDHERLEGGAVWPERLEAEARRASVMLVLVGEGWLWAQFYGAYRLGELIGFVLMLRDGDTGHLSYLGMNEGKMSFACFNVGYYQPVKDAISPGLKRLYFGTMLHDLKVGRGCQVAPASLYYRAGSRARNLALAPFFRVHRTWTSRVKLARVLALARSTVPR